MTRVITGSGGAGGKGGAGAGARDPYTEPDRLNSKQFATVVDLLSEGEIQGLVNGHQSIYLDNTPLQNPDGSYNFQQVRVRTRNGTQDQTYLELSEEISDTYPVGIEISDQFPVTRSIVDPNVDAVRVTVTAPQMQWYRQNGDINGVSIRLKFFVQYNGGGFTEVLRDSIIGRSADAYQKDYLIELSGAFPVDLRVERFFVDGDPQNVTEGSYIDTINWTSYTEITYERLRYPNSAVVAMRLAAQQFSSIPRRSYRIRGIKIRIPSNATVDQTNGRLIYTGIWDGTFGPAQWCSDPAWILYDILTSRYGLGDHIEESALDKWAFFAASKYCGELVPDGYGGQEPRFSCNVNIQTQDEAYKVINDLCSCFRSMPYWSTGALTIAQDRPSDTSYLFTLANVTEEGFSYQGASLKTRPNVAVVSYLDLERRENNYEVVTDEASVAKYGAVVTEVSAFACTSRGQARRLAEWILYSEAYEGEIVSFGVSIEAGIAVRPGQVIDISDPVRAGQRRGGRISSATDTTVTVDNADDVAFAAGASLAVILPDGTVESNDVASINGTTITVASPFTTAPLPNSIWVYQTPTLQTSTWRVLSVQEQDGAAYAVTAVAYNAGKYDYVERNIPFVDRDITDLNELPAAPTALSATEVLYETNGQAKVKIILSWQTVPGVSKYKIQWAYANDSLQTTTVEGGEYEILDTQPGTFVFNVWSLNAALLSSTQSAQLTYNALGKTTPPETPANLQLFPLSSNSGLLTWNRSTELDVVLGGKVIIRHNTATTGAVWDESQDVTAPAAGGQTQQQVPLIPGTYLIKFEDDAGNRSVTAATTVFQTLPEPTPTLTVANYREDLTSPPFNGAKTNTTYSSTYVGLIGSGAFPASAGEYVFASTANLGGVYSINLRRHIVSRPLNTGLLWDSRTDLIDTWSDIDGSTNDSTNAALYYRATNDNPAGTPTWGPWQEFGTATVTARGLQFKLVITSTDANQNIVIEQLGYLLELQQRIEQSATITSGAGTYSATFTGKFYQAPSISITPYNLGTGEYFAISNVTRTGFDIVFRNSSGTAVSRNFVYTANGYGREVI